LRRTGAKTVFPAYLDSGKTVRMGRRLPRGVSVPSPSLQELREACARLGLSSSMSAEGAYPRESVARTGFLRVGYRGGKGRLLRMLASEVRAARSSTIKRSKG